MSNGVVQVSCLGRLGRFGNQLFQYAFARGYAEAIGARLETPPWIGQTLFGLNDHPMGPAMPSIELDKFPTGQTNIDLWGYFQHADCLKYCTRTKLRQWFTFETQFVHEYPYRPGTVAAHMRRGDYLDMPNIFCTVEETAYLNAIKKHGYAVNQVLWVKESAPRHSPWPQYDWLNDFFILYNADVVFRANSTFSWWAATIGHAKKVFSPVVEGKRGSHEDVEFVEGNHPRCVDMSNISDYILAP